MQIKAIQSNAMPKQCKAKQCKATKQDAFNNAFGLSLTKEKKNLIGVAPGSFLKAAILDLAKSLVTWYPID